MQRVFPFTNENLTESLSSMPSLSGAEILSVVGSGDQYFSCILNGAKKVELYDINDLAWKYFVLKFYAIQVLSYEEFWKFFIDCREYERYEIIEIFRKFADLLPLEICRFFADFILRNDNISRLYVINGLFHGKIMYNANYNKGQFIPYLRKESYYELQNILRNRQLPKFYNTDLLQLPQEVGNIPYDLVLTSNIFAWIHKEGYQAQNIAEYKKFLSQFTCEEIQANYLWSPDQQNINAFENEGFKLTRVKPIYSENNFDTVITMKGNK